MELEGSSVYVAGHGGMVGSAIVRRLADSDCNLLTATRSELDLMDERSVNQWFADHRPEVVFLAAAKVGGIVANSTNPVAFLGENLKIQQNTIAAAHQFAVRKLVFLGSSCIYPRDAQQPIVETDLLSGPLETTNEWYAIAKIAGLKLCQAYRAEFGDDFISTMPCNLYGPNDNFDRDSSHVVPALIGKTHEAKVQRQPLRVWGTGRPRREFLHVDDAADAIVFSAENYSDALPLNIGYGSDITIRELVNLICEVVGYEGEVLFDPSMPDGTPRKLMDSGRVNALGWQPRTRLAEGLASTYAWYLQNKGEN